MSPCLTCGHRILVHYPNNEPCIEAGCTCTKYEGAPATTPTAVAGPPLDLQQAIRAAKVLRAARDQLAEIDGRKLGSYSMLLAALPAGATALEQLQAAQAEVEQVEQSRRLLTLEVEEACKQLADTQAENQQLRDEVAWMRAALLRADPRHEEAIRDALEQQAAPGQDNPHPFVAEQRSNLCLLFIHNGRTCSKPANDPIHDTQAAPGQVDCPHCDMPGGYHLLDCPALGQVEREGPP